MTTELYYSVENGGDGSATPMFSLSKLLVDIHQELVNMPTDHNIGWAEDCTGSVVIEHEGEIKFPYDHFFIEKSSVIEDIEYRIKDHNYVEHHQRLKEMLTELESE